MLLVAFFKKNGLTLQSISFLTLWKNKQRSRKKTLDERRCWLVDIFDFDHSFLTEQRKSVSSLLIGDSQKKQHCYHGANSRQKKDLLMKNVSFIRIITTISIQFLRFSRCSLQNSTSRSAPWFDGFGKCRFSWDV